MATYKVLQDIEAEDKLLGPLTLKQFIFAGIFIGLGFIAFMTLTSTAPSLIKIPIISMLLPFMLIFGFLAAPIGKDQPNDVWLIARVQFLFKPRRRIWNQDGISELVTITAPKREIQVYTDGLSQTEVKSRLQALANTMDSRGWAVKNVTTNLYAQPGYLSSGTDSDRLVAPSEMPQEVSAVNIQASDDMLDTSNNPIAQHLNQLVQESTQAHRTQAVAQMRDQPGQSRQATPQDYWFMNQPAPAPSSVPADYSTFGSQPVVTPGTQDVHPAAPENADEKALGEKLAADTRKTREHITDHMRVVQPLHDRDGKIVPRTATQPAKQTTKTETTPPNPAILGLAHNDDLNVATIARQAKKLSKDDDEVVISLR